MKRKIPVSVIIATYNSKESLERVLESLCAQDFDFSKFEVIIVDDCSGDGTVEML